MRYQKYHNPECYQTDHVQVLDIETLAPETEDGSFPPWPLHEPVCASVLSQKKTGDRFEFDIVTIDFSSEREGLSQLFELLDPAATLVTWNGRGFDVPVLQIAAARQLIFEDNAMRTAWLAPRWAINHADLAEIYGRFGGAGRPSLANVCKALGISAKTQGIRAVSPVHVVAFCGRSGREWTSHGYDIPASLNDRRRAPVARWIVVSTTRGSP